MALFKGNLSLYKSIYPPLPAMSALMNSTQRQGSRCICQTKFNTFKPLFLLLFALIFKASKVEIARSNVLGRSKARLDDEMT
jgi:hypothetical protein